MQNSVKVWSIEGDSISFNENGSLSEYKYELFPGKPGIDRIRMKGDDRVLYGQLVVKDEFLMISVKRSDEKLDVWPLDISVGKETETIVFTKEQAK